MSVSAEPTAQQTSDAQYQQMLDSYHQLVALRQQLDNTNLIQGATGPVGPPGAFGDKGVNGSGPVYGGSGSVIPKTTEAYAEMEKREAWLKAVTGYMQTVRLRIEDTENLLSTLEADIDQLTD
ncbi:MAG: hypothetical protein P8X74_10425 [Reinekea sp.]